MRAPSGTLEFYHNYLNYSWRLPHGLLAARCYLDECEKLSFSVSKAALLALDTGAVLAFSQRRFSAIATLEVDGYQTQWTRNAAQ